MVVSDQNICMGDDYDGRGFNLTMNSAQNKIRRKEIGKFPLQVSAK
jgi:hypothetical protein